MSSQALQNMLAQKKPFSGTPNISIKTGLQLKESAKEFNVSQAIANFSIKNTPESTVVFQEDFTNITENFEITRSIPVSDTARRYTLRAELLNINGSPHQIRININGNDWITEQDFSDNTTEAKKTSLLLNTMNRLRLRVQPGSAISVKISLIEEGSAGIVLRRTGSLKLPEETQETHLEQNDQNIFDPTQPDSLGGLTPYQGDVPLSDGSQLSGMQVNQEERLLQFQSGVLSVEFQDPGIQWPLFQAQYGATLIEEQFGRYLVRLDLTKAPINRINVLISQYNTNALENIETVSFSSVSALQTFSILIDALINHTSWFKGIELNVAGKLNQTPASTTCSSNQDWEVNGKLNGGYTILSKNYFYNINGISWWIQDSNTEKAWEYSIGTGVKVAYIDSGFSVNHPEIKRRILKNSYYNNENNPYTDLTHGHNALMTGFAEKDNGMGTSGSAPNAQVAPYFVHASKGADLTNIVYSAEFASSLVSARAAKVDIIGSSTGFPGDFLWTNWLGIFIPSIVLYTINGQNIQTEILHTLDQQISVIISASNDSQDYKKFFPANMSGVIAVGAIEPRVLISYPANTPLNPFPLIRTSSALGCPPLTPDADKHLEVSNFSNFGDDLIWGPGNYVYVMAKDTTLGTSMATFNGTSAAAPFITGLVALMKSRNPDLQPSTIKQILLDASSSSSGAHSAQPPGYVAKFNANGEVILLQDPDIPYLFPSNLIGKIRYINAEAALKDPRVGAKKSQTYLAFVDSEPNFSYRDENNLVLPGRKLRLNQFVQPGSVLTEREKQVPEQTVSHEAFKRMEIGKVVRVKGWSDVIAGRENIGNGTSKIRITQSQIEISDVQEICDTRQSSGCATANLKPENLPEITGVEFGPLSGNIVPGYQPVSSTGFKMRIHGKNLIANLLDGNENSRFSLQYIPYSSSTGLSTPVMTSAIAQSEIESIANDGSEVTFRMPAYVPATGSGAGKGMAPGNFALLLNGLTTTPVYYGNQGFKITANGTGGIGILSANGVSVPENRYEYDLVGNRWLIPGGTVRVDANEFAGIHFNQPVRNLEIKIGPVLVPLIDVLGDLAVFGIPEDLPAGVHDVVVKASNQTLTLEHAVEKVSQAIPPAPEPSPPPSGNPGSYSHVRIYNLEGNDEGRIYLNNNLILTAHAGEDASVSVGEYGVFPLKTDGRNEFRFELTNNGGGYTYGFELNGNGRAVYTDAKGTPGTHNVTLANGQEDQTQGLVYNERLIVNNKVSPVGSGPYWFKVFNLGDNEAVTLDTYNEINDPSWQSGFQVTSAMGTVSRSLPLLPFNENGYHCGSIIASPGQECWRNTWLNFYFENPLSPYSFGIEVYKGINLIYRNIQGQANRWGANDNQETDYVSITPFVGAEYLGYIPYAWQTP